MLGNVCPDITNIAHCYPTVKGVSSGISSKEPADGAHRYPHQDAKSATSPYKLTDSGGLHILVKPNGAKLSGVTAIASAAKKICLLLATTRRLPFAGAREKRDEARKLVKQGIHPATARYLKASQIAANANSFESVALEWIRKTRTTGRHIISTRLIGS